MPPHLYDCSIAPNFSCCSLAQLHCRSSGVMPRPFCFVRHFRLLRPPPGGHFECVCSCQHVALFAGEMKKQQAPKELWEFPTVYGDHHLSSEKVSSGLWPPRSVVILFAPGFQPPILHLALNLYGTCVRRRQRDLFRGSTCDPGTPESKVGPGGGAPARRHQHL